MRGMDESYGMGAGASVRKGKTAKQVRRARKAIDAKKSVSSSSKKSSSSSSSKKSSSVTDASSRMSYRAPGTKAKAMPRRSADAYGSTAKKRQGELGALSPVLKFVTRGAAKGFKNIQNKGPGTSAYKAKNKK